MACRGNDHRRGEELKAVAAAHPLGTGEDQAATRRVLFAVTGLAAKR